MSLGLHKIVTTIQSVIQPIIWIPPKNEWITLNTDEALKGERLAGCGGLIRDQHGAWRSGFSKHIDNCTVGNAELWEIYEGLKHVFDKEYRKMEL